MYAKLKVRITVILELTFFLGGCYSQSLQNVTALHKHLLNDYRNSPIIRPILNQKDPVNVHLHLYLHRLVKFDEINGLIYIIATLGMAWIDEIKVWDSGHFGLSKIHFMGSEVWTPDIRLINQGGQLLSVRCTAPEDEVTYDDKGNAYCFIAHQFVISCSPNMFRFPFDEHTCPLLFQTKAPVSEILLVAPKLITDIHFVSTFLQWKLTPLNFELSRDETLFIPQVTYFVLLQRNPYFILLNVVLPNCLLGVLHFLVFYLPIESGERISYSCTIYLAIIVFISNISSLLPQTSNPISVFNVIMFSQLCFSSCVMAAVIIITRVYYIDEGTRMSALVKKVCLTRGGQLHRVKLNGINPWKEIGKSMDRLMFYIFLFFMCAEVVVVCVLVQEI